MITKTLLLCSDDVKEALINTHMQTNIGQNVKKANTKTLKREEDEQNVVVSFSAKSFRG